MFVDMTLDRLSPSRVWGVSRKTKTAPWKKAWARRLSGKQLSAFRAQEIVQQYEMAIAQSDDASCLPFASPETSERVRTTAVVVAGAVLRSEAGR